MEKQTQQAGKQQEVSGIGHPGTVPGRFHVQVHATLGIFFRRSGEISLNLEDVVAGRNIGVGGGGLACGSGFPVCVEAAQAIGIDQALRVGVFGNGEIQLEQICFARNLDPGCL